MTKEYRFGSYGVYQVLIKTAIMFGKKTKMPWETIPTIASPISASHHAGLQVSILCMTVWC